MIVSASTVVGFFNKVISESTCATRVVNQINKSLSSSKATGSGHGNKFKENTLYDENVVVAKIVFNDTVDIVKVRNILKNDTSSMR